MEQEKTLEQVYAKEIERMRSLGMDPVKILKELSFALQHINKSDSLQKTSQESKRAAIVNIANIGLTLNPVAKEAYLIPRKGVCVLEPSYVGLVKLLTDSGSIVSMVCSVVYENDIFDLDKADNQKPITHKPQLSKAKQGKIIGAYALATLHDGTRQPEWMDIDELYGIRERSESYKSYVSKGYSCTWITDETEMMRKTVVKRIYKYLPRTDRMEHVDNAISLDNEDYLATDEQVGYIHSLLENSTLDHDQRRYIENELTLNLPSYRASQIIENLKLNQMDRITQGGAYNQGDIKNHCESLA